MPAEVPNPPRDPNALVVLLPVVVALPNSPEPVLPNLVAFAPPNAGVALLAPNPPVVALVAPPAVALVCVEFPNRLVPEGAPKVIGFSPEFALVLAVLFWPKLNDIISLNY